MANVIHPQGYGPVSHQETRTTARSAQRCAVIWMAGLSVAIAAFIGMLSGALGGFTGAMDMAAAILYCS